MIKVELGRLEKVADLKAVWDHEARDFTPWLAEEQNLSLLADTLGEEFQKSETEKKLGIFKADIVCETSRGTPVLIENQLERTDHGHLGQLITYAAGLDAAVIVWISREFTLEHRAALNWLNEITRQGVDFFGLEIELWRIGDSTIAPKFNIVCQPNEWSKATKDFKDRPERDLLFLEYWEQFNGYLKEHSKTLKPRKPAALPFISFGVGRQFTTLDASLTPTRQRIDVQIYLWSDKAVSYFEQLKENKEEIEKALGMPLTWIDGTDRRGRYIRVVRENSDIYDRSLWPEQFQWITHTLEKFYEVFSPRIRSLADRETAENGSSET